MKTIGDLLAEHKQRPDEVYIRICREMAEMLNTMAAKVETSEYGDGGVTWWGVGSLEKIQTTIQNIYVSDFVEVEDEL